jgi:hypothetical protein
MVGKNLRIVAPLLILEDQKRLQSFLFIDLTRQPRYHISVLISET